MDVTWICDSCSRPIADGDGYVQVLYDDKRRYRQERKAWDAAHLGRIRCAADLLALPEPAKWHALHTDCDPSPGTGYGFGVERIRTYRDALEWTVHLMGKVWLQDTDWDYLLERVLRGGR
ncbi:MAG: hypothetical protein Q4G46_00205 [Propionibacteriaceae bacterium]|nr:hypothetical protein [Propionibacteriaceae bacterium]